MPVTAVLHTMDVGLYWRKLRLGSLQQADHVAEQVTGAAAAAAAAAAQGSEDRLTAPPAGRELDPFGVLASSVTDSADCCVPAAAEQARCASLDSAASTAPYPTSNCTAGSSYGTAMADAGSASALTCTGGVVLGGSAVLGLLRRRQQLQHQQKD